MTPFLPLTNDEFRLLTWTGLEFSKMTIEPESLEKNCPLDNGRLEQPTVSKSNSGSKRSNTGTLRAFPLPLEIMSSILSLLDLRSLTNFRAVSWGSRALVDGLPKYKSIIHHAPNALRALLSTKTARYFTALDLFKALSSQACVNCGRQFGPLLSMFTCHRYCLSCIKNGAELLCLPLSAAKRMFLLQPDVINKLRTCWTLPGRYGEIQNAHRRRYTLVRVREIPWIKQSPPYLGFEYHDKRGRNSYRFMSMLRIPALAEKTGKLDWGVSCRSCRFGPRIWDVENLHANTLYSSDDYSEHFRICESSHERRKTTLESMINVSQDQQNAVLDSWLV